jgi:hypothetical protein
LIKQDDESITISADKDDLDEDDLFGRSQVIPKGVVLRVEYLRLDD